MSAASTFVSLMASDLWATVKHRFVAVLGQEKRMDATHSELLRHSGAEQERARNEQVMRWQHRLRDMLEEHPEIATDLLALLSELQENALHAQPRTGDVRQMAQGVGNIQVVGGGDVNVNSPIDKRKFFIAPWALVINIAKTAAAHPIASTLAILVIAGASAGGVIVSKPSRPTSKVPTGSALGRAAGDHVAPSLTWKVETIAPSVAPTFIAALNTVACASAVDCWALGLRSGEDAGTDQEMIEHFDGTSWRLEPSALPESVRLIAATCPAPTSCWGVGNGKVVHYDGQTWQVSRLHVNGIGPGPSDIACPTANECWIVGSHGTVSHEDDTLMLHFDGTSWREFPTPTIGGGRQQLDAVSCASRSDCWAVGWSASGTLAEHFDGHAWTRQSAVETASSAQPNNGPALVAVTGSAVSDCWFGTMTDPNSGGASGRFILQHLTGGQLTNTPLPDASASMIYCIDRRNCMAAGRRGITTGSTPTLNRWNGSRWLPVPVPTFQAVANAEFRDITCVTPKQCWAVGLTGPAGSSAPLIARVAAEA